MALLVTFRGNGMKRFEEAVIALGSREKAQRAFVRAINRTGTTVGNEAGRALSDQTNLPKSTGKKAYRRNVDKASPGNLAYTIHGSGGEISLKYFKPRETKAGVSAAPWGKRRVYPSTFMKAGWWPKRVNKPGWNRQVFERANSSGYGKSFNPASGKTERQGTKFNKVRSGMFIPIEMVQGHAAAAFLKSGPRLEARVTHEIKAITKGVVS